MRHKATPTIKPTTKQIESPLQEIQKQFEDWRNTKQKREPIPEALWDAAVKAVPYNPISGVARVLRLNYRELKKRVHIRYGDNPFGMDLSAGFIEVDSKELLNIVECIVEMEKPDGAKMKMQIKSGNRFNPLELAKAFWQKRS